MYTIPKLEESKLIKDLNVKIIPIIKKKIRIDERKKEKLTKKEDFLIITYQLILEIENKFKDLDACVLFISSYPKSSAAGKLLSRSEYLLYHLEFYYIGVVGTFDRLLKIVNHIYGLGLADKHTTLDVILNNSNISSNLKKLLKEFNKSLLGIRTLQNKIKHKEKMWDSKLKNAIIIEGLLLINPTGLKKKEILRYKAIAKIEHMQYRREKKNELKNNNKTLADILFTIFEEINSIYENNLDSILDR